MLSLSNREQAIFDYLKSKRPHVRSLDEIHAHLVKTGVLEKLTNPNKLNVQRKSVIMSMKYMAAKLPMHGWYLISNGARGRGHRIVYELAPVLVPSQVSA